MQMRVCDAHCVCFELAERGIARVSHSCDAAARASVTVRT